MKTAVIRYRVADFLKQHPPFDLLPEEQLLELVGTGRVTFHESEEYLFRKGQPRDGWIRVIQQGKVEILDEQPNREKLRDVLGEGDLLGFGKESYSHAARTASDVILYSVAARAFEDLAGKYPKMGRYLAAYSPVEKTTWLDAEGPSTQFLRGRLRTCTPGASIQEVARLLADSRGLAVVNSNGCPLGLVTDREIRESVAGDKALAMNSRVPAAPAGLAAASYLFEMICARSRYLWITSDGTASSSLVGVLHDEDLALACGRNPVALMFEILGASSVEELVRLRRYRDELLMETLTGPEAVETCQQIAVRLDGAFVESVIRLAAHETPGPYCWLLFGRAGRAEIVAPEFPSLGVIAPDSGVSGALASIERFLEKCGLGLPPVLSAPRCLSLEEWKQYYSELIQNPIANGIYSVRSMFDFRPVAGDQALARELQDSIAAELERAHVFIPLLANDTLAHLPPMTFFRGVVVELDGAERNTLDIERYALQPVEDAARVFALADRRVSSTNTLERLAGAASNPIFEDAAEAFRAASFQFASARFKNPGNAVIDPSALGRYDQRQLKTAFQSIRELLGFTASSFLGISEL